MHEMSIAVALLDRVLAEAAKGGLCTVTRLAVEVGALQAVEPELLKEAFSAAALGSLAQGARLDLQMRAAEARCQACSGTFKPTYQSYVCPHCGQADVRIIKGKELYLLSLSGEAADPTLAEGARP